MNNDNDPIHLSPKQLDEIVNMAAERAARRAAELVKAEFFQAFGRSIFDKLLWMIGAVVVALYLWAQSKGLIK